MSRYMSSRFDSLEAYVPREQPQDMQYVKLNTNESPFPPAPEVLSAVNATETERLNLYPDPEGKLLREKLADMYRVKPANIFLANGSDELLSFAFMAFCDESRPVAFPNISYGFYPVYANLYRVPYTEIPLREGFVLDPADYCGLNQNVVIANPNAPTGRAIDLSGIEEIVRTNPNHVVLIDEAYIDFGGESCLPLIEKYDNLLVCQTFSKFRSLAGGRLGFALASEGLIADLDKIKYSTNSYNINRLTMAAAAATLASNDYYVENSKKIQANRAYTTEQLAELGFETLPSLTNFIFTRSSAVDGGTLYRELKSRGVLVRHWDKAEIADWCRVTIGTREQMDIFLDKVREIVKGRGPMRKAELSRRTAETDITLSLELDGTGKSEIDTGCGFLDHMLTLFARHGRFDLTVACKGDTYVDDHHTVEDIGICLGDAFARALGDKRGIVRYGSCTLPMDEALILTAVDISGRGMLCYGLNIPTEKVGTFDTELTREFLIAFARRADMTVHLRQLAGENSHHIIEGAFKSLARSLGAAVAVDPRFSQEIPSTKGVL